MLRARRPLIVGITGTVGKTTTVKMLKAVLTQDAVERRFGSIGVTTSNMNDGWGVPLTVLGQSSYFYGPLWRQLPHWLLLPFRAAWEAIRADYPRLWILEFGAGNKGHLKKLTRLTRPTIGVVTSIGAGHLGRLGSIEGVMEEKSALASAPPPDGLVVLGSGHRFVDELACRARAPVVVVEGEGLELNRNIVRQVCRALGVADALIDTGLARFSNEPRRLQRRAVGAIEIIDDSHNANPLSMKLGLDTLAADAGPGQRKVALLGGMAELGAGSEAMHRETGAHARRRADLVIGVGEVARAYQPDVWFPDVGSCARDIGGHLQPRDLILVKGSNSFRLWEAIDALDATADPLFFSRNAAGPPAASAEALPQAGERQPFPPARG